MSSNHGGASRRPEPAGHLRRPSFDRPSLFAGMEDDVVDVEPDRVRILSSLEPRKRAAAPRARKGQRQRKAARARWWSRALIGLMAMGLVTVGLSVYLLLRSAHDTEQALSSWPLPTSTASMQTSGEGEWLIDPPAAGPLDAAVAQAEAAALMSLSAQAESARIETVAPDIVATATPVVTAPESPASAATPAANPLAALAPPAEAVTRAEATPATQKPTQQPTQTSTQTPAPAPARVAAPAKTASANAPTTATTATTAAAQSTARATSRADADVSLLEAVFPNHDPVKASRADLFRACQGMNGPEAAICRARICVQHPGVPACQ